MPKPAAENRRYMPGLDGLRALAVLAVIAYHLNVSATPGGLLGVGMFFVLSGYLITDLLVAEWRAHGTIRLKDFWGRRARRLLPAMLTMLVAVVIWVCLFDPSQVHQLWGDAASALFYVSNWWFIFHKVSYFNSFGLPSPLKHLWSLAVEEQFYLVWPILLFIGLRVRLRPFQLIGWTLTGAGASALAMALLFHPGTDPSRVYYGTDTRAFSLLIGSVLAFVFPSCKLAEKRSRRTTMIFDGVGLTGLAVAIAFILFTNEYETFLYRGGMVLLSLSTAAMVAALAQSSSFLTKMIGCPPLRWLGVRSYGIYLWHYPVIVLTSSALNIGTFNPVRAVLQVSASIMLAALSWRYIEQPIRHGAMERAWRRSRSTASGRRRLRMIGGGALAAFLVVTLLSWSTDRFTSVANAEAHTGTSASSTGVVYSVGKGHANAVQYPSGNITTGNGSTNNGSHNNGNPNTTVDSTSTVKVVYGVKGRTHVAGTGEDQSTLSGKGMTAIGDSLMVDIEPYLKKDLPGIVVDGKIGRQMYQAPSVVKRLKAKGELGKRVIIELGTNGVFSQKQLVSLLNSLGNVQQIVLVNTRVPRPWEKPVNAVLAKVAQTYPHTTLVNWYADSANKSAMFYSDGVHLRPDGAKYLASLITKAIEAQTSHS